MLFHFLHFKIHLTNQFMMSEQNSISACLCVTSKLCYQHHSPESSPHSLPPTLHISASNFLNVTF